MCELCQPTSKPKVKEVSVNAHLHTPYSFSAFDTLTDSLERAVAENVKVVGINDFYTTAGYTQWNEECRKRHLYPLFNIEFISLHKADQEAGVRVNDPNNPGRTYLSGKGLACPASLPEPYASQLAGVCTATHEQVKQMCEKLNELLARKGKDIVLDFEWIKQNLTNGSIRERHLAKALRIKAQEKYGDAEEELTAFFAELFEGKPLKSNLKDLAGLENEIRGNLLKAGGAAFVAETPAAFLPVEDVRQIILAAGGIPTYPFLADDAKGNFTQFEADVRKTAAELKRRGFFSVEFIPTRNSLEVLEEYAGYLHDSGFVVTFGSEHNTPAMEPIELSARGGVPLSAKLRQINYEGACVVAAHQELVKSGKQGYVDSTGRPDVGKRDDYIAFGDQAIKAVIG